MPPRKDRYTNIDLPQIASAKDAVHSISNIVNAVVSGNITPCEATELSRSVKTYFKTMEISELEQRLRHLEGKLL